MRYLEATEACTLEYVDPATLSRSTVVRYLDRNHNKRIKRGPGKGRLKKIGIYKYHKAPNPKYYWR